MDRFWLWSLLGIIMIVAIFLIFLTAGWVEVMGWANLPDNQSVVNNTTITALTLFAFVLFESLWVWSYVLRNLAEGFVYLDRLNAVFQLLPPYYSLSFYLFSCKQENIHVSTPFSSPICFVLAYCWPSPSSSPNV